MNVAVGHVWKECDPRVDRYVRVVDVDHKGGTVGIVRCGSGEAHVSERGARITRATIRRFNGKRGGYVWVSFAKEST